MRYVLALLGIALTVTAADPAVLCLGRGADGWPVARKLNAEYGFQVGEVAFNKLTWETLQQYNAVIVFDMSRLDPESKRVDGVIISPEGFQHVGDLLERYVRAGGGLYCYGVSFTHMGQGWAGETLNRFLARFDAQALFEEFRDPPQEARQPGGRKVLYARADQITEHPATAGVRNLWYAVGPFSYGPWTRPLKLGDDWTSLVRSSTDFESTPLGDPQAHARPIEGAKTAVPGDRATVYAARLLGDGRIVLNGGESTISWYGYAYSAFADEQWGRIGMEAGLEGIPSDGLKLLVSSLKWVCQPSLEAGTFGGYVMPPEKKPEIPHANPIAWTPPREAFGERAAARGAYVVLDNPARAGEYVAVARDLGLDYLVAAGTFETMAEADWQALMAACAKGSDAAFLAMPALVTRDEVDNSFLQCGPKSWPSADQLSAEQPKRLRKNLDYWMVQAGFPVRVAFNFGAGTYPPWLLSAYNAFAVRTWRDGELIDEALAGFRQVGINGDRALPVAVHLLSGPEKLRDVRDFSYLFRRGPDQLRTLFQEGHFYGGTLGYVSTGPRLTGWAAGNGTRNTFGDGYVPGTERWRLEIGVVNDTPLTEVELWDYEALWRRFAVTGTAANLTVDALHDNRHVLTAVIRDAAGNTAITGSIEIQDRRLWQCFCSDRCNIMLGHSSVRQPDGQEKGLPATTMIYKAGRLSVCAVSPGESLPGIDGSGTGAVFGLYADLRLEGVETRSIVHRIDRPVEDQDLILYDLPILKRSPTPGHLIYGHAPYVPLVDPAVAAGMRQWHFYREDRGFFPTMAEVYLTNTTDQPMPRTKGWQGFSVQWWQSPGWFALFDRFAILRADGSRVERPDADGNGGFRGQLETGDIFWMPDLGEGFAVLAGSPDIVVDFTPGKRARFWLGETEDTPVAPGETLGMRALLFKFRVPAAEAETALLKMRADFGLADGQPVYPVTVTRGAVRDRRYVLRLAADGPGVRLALPEADLQQRLPIQVDGLAAAATAGVVDLVRNTWKPLTVTDGTLYTTVDTQRGDYDLYIGNLLTCDAPDLTLTLLPANADGPALAAVHNPTDKPITASVGVPIDTFLAPAGDYPVTVPPGTTVRLPLAK